MKKLLSFFFAILCVSILAGCAVGGNTDHAIPDELDTSKEISIDYWHANGKDLTAVLEEIKADFETAYPTITVNLTSYGDYKTLRDTISSNIAAGNAPTAAQTYPDHVSLYIEGEALRPLDEYVNHSKWGLTQEEQNKFIAGFYQEGTIYDKQKTRYAIPFNKSTEIMYYNSDIFEKYGWAVPTTWDEVVEIAKKWMETDEYKTAKTTYGDQVAALGYDSEANLFITMTQQYGGDYTAYNAKGEGIFSAFGDDETSCAKSKQAISWYKNQFDKRYLATTKFFGTNYCSDAFLNGQCIMTIGSSAGSSHNDGQKSTVKKFVTKPSTYPQLAKDSKGYTIQQGTNVSLFKCTDAQEELAGWLWLKFMTSYESSLRWALETSYFPTRTDVLSSQAYQDHIAGKITAEDGSVVYKQTLAALTKQVGLSQQNWFYTNIAFPGSSVARDNAETLIQEVLYGAGYTVDSAYLEAYNKTVNN